MGVVVVVAYDSADGLSGYRGEAPREFVGKARFGKGVWCLRV